MRPIDVGAWVAILVVVVIALYLFGKWRLNQLDWRRDLSATAGLAILGLLLALAFSGPEPLAMLVPPMILALGGSYLVLMKPSTDRLQRTVGQLALASGFTWIAIGLIILMQR